MKSLLCEGCFWIMHGIFMFIRWLLPDTLVRTKILIKIFGIQTKFMLKLVELE